jgi:high-affinity K+ transport system ATPase subunit B
MKTRSLSIVLIVAATLWATPTFAAASEDVAVDALLVRPVCMVATAVGSVLFCVTLPFAAVSKSVKTSAHALVVRPAKAAFRRPLGDFSTLQDVDD